MLDSLPIEIFIFKLVKFQFSVLKMHRVCLRTIINELQFQEVVRGCLAPIDHKVEMNKVDIGSIYTHTLNFRY